MNAKDIAGLFCDDITFCHWKCDTRTCPRNRCNIRDNSVPHSFFAEAIPPNDCPKRRESTGENEILPGQMSIDDYIGR